MENALLHNRRRLELRTVSRTHFLGLIRILPPHLHGTWICQVFENVTPSIH